MDAARAAPIAGCTRASDLPDWHPLITGDPESVHRAGVSVRGQTISEARLKKPEDAMDFAAADLSSTGATIGREP